MSLNTLRSSLLEKPSFQASMIKVIKSGVLDEFPVLTTNDSNCREFSWAKLLGCASLLAKAEQPDLGQKAALRIADTCLKSRASTISERDAAAVILHMMANTRSITLAESRSIIARHLHERLPLPLKVDYLIRDAEFCIETQYAGEVPVNTFQLSFWCALKDGGWVSASAPTSAGKSFILRAWVHEIFKCKPKSQVAFLVPTRALIQEISEDFMEDQTRGLLEGVIISTLPLEDSHSSDIGTLCIFTQERLHILLGRKSEAKFDLIIVDEAQKIGDGHRGVLLEQVINESIRRNNTVQYVFASPFSENPEYLNTFSVAGAVSKVVDRPVTTVTQNLLFVKQVRGKPLDWTVRFIYGDEDIEVGTFKIHARPLSDQSKRFCYVAFALRNRVLLENARNPEIELGGNLLYANGAAEAEKYASCLATCYRESHIAGLETNSRIVALSDLIRKAIHPQYALADTILQGVAYHYGNMPLVIRSEIESLFKANILRFLVCTGTLIEGVNLPCKNIFLRGPTKGRGNPMHGVDFWNLAGRAGRWGTEFHGSIVCVDPEDPDVWKISPPRTRVMERIISSSDRAVSHGEDFVKYLDAGCRMADNSYDSDFDYTMTYMLGRHYRGDDLSGLSCIAALPEVTKLNLIARLITTYDGFALPKEYIFRHPGILPQSLLQLYRALAVLSPDQLRGLFPLYPEDREAANRYVDIFRCINSHLRADWQDDAQSIYQRDDRRLYQLAILAVEWMRGFPLALLIRKREQINKKRIKPQSLSSVIRGVMSDVEEYARFKIPKYLRAYLDVLNYRLQEIGLTKVEGLDDIELWLELGVSVRTQMSLMELGLSRTSAIEVFSLFTRTDLDKITTLTLLRLLPSSSLNTLPELIRKEVDLVLKRFS